MMPEEIVSSGVEWIGDIPSSWVISPFKYCASIDSGYPADSAFFNTEGVGIPLLRIRDITSGQTDTWYSGSYPAALVVSSGDVLIGMDGDFNLRVWDGPDALLNQRCCRIKGVSIDTSFLSYCLEFPLRRINDLTVSTTVKHLLVPDIESILLPVPSREEQRRIVCYLDELCGSISLSISSIERQIDLLERYRASVIHEVVTKGLNSNVPMKPSGVEWIGDIPNTWVVRKLKHLVRRFESGTSVRAAAYPANQDEIGVLSLSSVFGGSFHPQENKRVDDDECSRVSCPVRGGTLLISRCNTSEWVGLPAYIELDYPNLYLPDKLWQVDCGSTEINRFLWYSLRSKYAREYCAVMSVGASSSMQNIASFDLLNMFVPMPTSAREIVDITRYLDGRCSAIDAVIDTKRKQRDALKKRRQSLIYEYVIGKRRVGTKG